MKKKTTEEQKRLDVIHLTPCLPCMLTHVRKQPNRTTAQHVTEGGRRLGHDYTYASCEYHHQGFVPPGMSKQEAIGLWNVSFAHGKKYFTEIFGDEREVLCRVQDMIVELHDAGDWATWNDRTARGARLYWEDLRKMN